MIKYPKGVKSRNQILAESRNLLNEKGLNQTMEMLAKEMGLSRGRITNYFPTKDTLLLNIMLDYEHKLNLVLQSFDWGKRPSLAKILEVISLIMNVQYEYRCAIAYIATVSRYQPELQQHIERSFSTRVEEIKLLLTTMVDLEMLQPAVLQAPDFDMFCFQYTNLLTTWVISQQLYFGSRPYSEMKPNYLKGVMALYIPYLTPKGKRAFVKLDYGFSK
jgi:AcrR family transcriptional regulator